jgi:AbrB family looped-hinge helix DNA binding protein
MAAEAKVTTQLSTKGQVILPAAIRRRHGWNPGTVLLVEDTAEGVLLRPARPFAPTRVDAVFGMLRRAGPARTVEEMDAAIADELRARHDRGRY